MARFERVDLELAEWGKILSTFPDAIVYQTPAWLSFLAETQKGEPVFAVLKEKEEVVGYFSGLVVKKFCLKILGSPFRGWTCPYMGFNVRPGVSRRQAIAALPDLAFKELGCAHFEVVDSYLTVEETAGLGLEHESHGTFEVDITQTEESLFAHMSSSCRRNIRHAEKNNLRIEEASDDAFAEDFHGQLVDVFAKQGLVPTFGLERVRALLKHMHPSGMLLCLRARDAEGRCIATGLYPATNKAAFYWGGASWRQYQKLYPNELLHWHAMKYWKARGMSSYNLVGTMDFKARFGGRQTSVPMLSKSRNRLIASLRSTAPKILKACLRLAWKGKAWAGRREAPQQ
jgi:hypothetical protein